MKLSNTKTFLPKRSSLVFVFEISILNSITSHLSNVPVQQTTSVSQAPLPTFGLMLSIEVRLKLSHTLKPMIKKKLFNVSQQTFDRILMGNHTSTSSLSWLWRKRFMPGILGFMSYLTSLTSQKLVCFISYLLAHLCTKIFLTCIWGKPSCQISLLQAPFQRSFHHYGSFFLSHGNRI